MKLFKKAKLTAAAIGAAGLAAGAAGVMWRSNHHLSTASYTLTLDELPPAFSGLRIVHLSDLHAASFGRDQAQLLALIDRLDADMVLITGDLIDRRRTVTDSDMHPALILLSELAKRMPTLRVDGNHEPMSAVGRRFTMLADRTGAQNVTGRGLVVRKGDDHIVILGVPDVSTVQYDEDAWRRQMHMVCAPYATSFRLALAHRPHYLEDYAAEGLPVVLSGHAHGGQVRLPVIGGLYAPEQGVFPKYTKGRFECGDTQMVVSRGLGNSGFPIRFANNPEVGLITLVRRDP